LKSKIVAITVGEDYLRKGEYCIKNLTIGYRKDATPFWHVQNMVGGYIIRETVVSVAMEISRNHQIMYVFDVKNGQGITPFQKDSLKTYGVTV